MPCMAVDDNLRMTDSSLTCDDQSSNRQDSYRRITPPSQLPSVSAASNSSSCSTASLSSSCRRLPMWRSLSSLWKKSSPSAVTRTTNADVPADDAASETQACSFVRTFCIFSFLIFVPLLVRLSYVMRYQPTDQSIYLVT